MLMTWLIPSTDLNETWRILAAFSYQRQPRILRLGHLCVAVPAKWKLEAKLARIDVGSIQSKANTGGNLSLDFDDRRALALQWPPLASSIWNPTLGTALTNPTFTVVGVILATISGHSEES